MFLDVHKLYKKDIEFPPPTHIDSLKMGTNKKLSPLIDNLSSLACFGVYNIKVRTFIFHFNPISSKSDNIYTIHNKGLAKSDLVPNMYINV